MWIINYWNYGYSICFIICRTPSFNHTGKHLDDLQKTIIEGVFQGNKYVDIADKIPCSEGYVRDKTSDLWKVLSNLSGE